MFPSYDDQDSVNDTLKKDSGIQNTKSNLSCQRLMGHITRLSRI